MRRICLALCCLLVASLHPAARQRPDILGKLTTAKRTVTVFGQQLAYYEAGRGRTMVLLPNLTWDSHAWSQNLPAFAAKYHVIALDLPGTGDSAKPFIDYKMDTWTDFIAEFLRVKGISRATIVGAVMGGALAVQFALDHPEMLEGLVCAASNSGPGKQEGGSPLQNWPSLAGTRRALLASFHDKSGDGQVADPRVDELGRRQAFPPSGALGAGVLRPRRYGECRGERQRTSTPGGSHEGHKQAHTGQRASHARRRDRAVGGNRRLRAGPTGARHCG